MFHATSGLLSDRLWCCPTSHWYTQCLILLLVCSQTNSGAALRHTGPLSASCYFRFALRQNLVLSCAILVHAVSNVTSGLLSDKIWCCPAPYWSTQCLMLFPVCFQTNSGAVLHLTGPPSVSCYFRFAFKINLVLSCSILVHAVSNAISGLLSDKIWCCPAPYWSTQCLMLLPVCFKTKSGAVLRLTCPLSVSCYFRFAFILTLVLSCSLLVHPVSHATSGLLSD